MAKNRTCFVCGNKYDYCPSCERDKLKPSWYSLFCGDTCKELNDILSANTAKRMTDKEASDSLKSVDISKINIKNELVKNKINELLKYKDEAKTSQKKSEEKDK